MRNNFSIESTSNIHRQFLSELNLNDKETKKNRKQKKKKKKTSLLSKYLSFTIPRIYRMLSE